MSLTRSSPHISAHTAANLASAHNGAAPPPSSASSAAEDPRFTLGVTPQGSREEKECASAWQRHVDAGRIESENSMTAQQLMRHFRNEQILLGHKPGARRSVRVK